MQAAKPLDGFREGGFDLCLLADIALDEMSITAGIIAARARGLSRSLATLRVDLGNDDFGAFLRKAFGGGTANASATTRDECNFSRETRHEIFP